MKAVLKLLWSLLIVNLRIPNWIWPTLMSGQQSFSRPLNPDWSIQIKFSVHRPYGRASFQHFASRQNSCWDRGRGLFSWRDPGNYKFLGGIFARYQLGTSSAGNDSDGKTGHFGRIPAGSWRVPGILVGSRQVLILQGILPIVNITVNVKFGPELIPRWAQQWVLKEFFKVTLSSVLTKPTTWKKSDFDIRHSVTINFEKKEALIKLWWFCCFSTEFAFFLAI